MQRCLGLQRLGARPAPLSRRRPGLKTACRAVAGAETKVPLTTSPTTTSYSHLKDPAHIGGTAQYSSTVQLFNLWIEPVVEVTVRLETNPDCLILEAQNCKLRGSEFFQQLRLDERFAMRFVTHMTWTTTAPDAAKANGSGPQLQLPAPSTQKGVLCGDAKLDVWCEVIPPFNLMPRAALEGSGNVVMRGLVNTLLPMFVRDLAKDYTKWSNSETYRRERAARQAPLAY